MRRRIPKEHEYDETGQCKWCTHKDPAQASLAPVAGSADLVAWLRGKVEEAEKTLKTREDMAGLMRTGTNAEWAAAANMHPSTRGQTSSKADRLRDADAHDRIAGKLRHELAMFRATLTALDQPNPALSDATRRER